MPGLRACISMVAAWSAAILIACVPARAHAGLELTESWSAGYTRIELAPGYGLDAARQFVQARGGTVALLLPPSTLTGWIDPALDTELVGHAGIRTIVRAADASAAQRATPDERPARDRNLQAAHAFFARAARGELAEIPGGAMTPPSSAGGAADALPAAARMLPDARVPDDVSELEIAANLARAGVAVPQKSGTDLHLAANSDYMTGTVSVSLFFVESDGSGTDPDRYDWTSSAEQEVFDQTAAALSWWVNQAKKFSGCWVVFRLDAHFATADARCSQWREPMLHASTDFAGAVQDVLGNFGYTAGGHLSRAYAYDAAQRLQNGTDWSYAAFVIANPSGANELPDGYAAWGYIGGPYLVALQNSFGWSFKQVFAHESAHMFRACDEYYTPGYGGCTTCSSCADTGVPNGNCEQCNSTAVTCMMRTNSYAVCSYTAGQIGWWRTPCTEYALPAPHLATVTPAEARQGTETDVDLQGDFLATGSTVSFGAGVNVGTVTFVSDSHLRVHVRVGLDTATGTRDVSVTGPDGQWDLLSAAFRIRATPRHYVAMGGGNIFPYDTPATAGVSVASVLEACSTGDTLLVAAGTYAPIAIHKSVVLLGGWGQDFGIRLPASQPTVVQGTPNASALTIDGAASQPVVDGLVLRNGAGTFIATPDFGTIVAGGGIVVTDAAPLLRDCLIAENAVGTAAAPGVGGGGFFWRARPTLERCQVYGNRASLGAGLYFLSSDARLVATSIEANDAGGDGRGAGLAARGSQLDVQAGEVRGNRGALDGGGLDLEACPRVQCTGLVCDDNHSSRYGGGIAAQSSRLELTGCRITRNLAGQHGGGVYATDDTLRCESTVCAANGAGTLGGGLYLTRCLTTLQNVTVARNQGGPVSGIYWADAPGGGSMRDCIVAGNTLGGAALAGSAAPLVDRNVYWDNGGLDRLGMPAADSDSLADPRFAGADSLDFRLALGSPGLDGGDPDPARADADGSCNDRGAHGGPRAAPAQPASIRGLAALATPTGVRLTWDPSRDRAIAAYVIHRADGGAARSAMTQALATLPAPTTNWLDAEPVAGAWYAIVALDAKGAASGVTLWVQAVLPSDAPGASPALALRRIAPNPANPGAWIEFELPLAVEVQLNIFDARGRHVRALARARSGPGPQRLYWNGTDDSAQPVASGVYWVRLTTPVGTRAQKLVVVR